MAALKVFLRGAAVALIFAASACSSAGRNSVAEAPLRPGVVDAGAVQLEELAAQPLTAGACGLFLWARAGGDPVFVLAAFSQPSQARVRIDGRDRTLPRTAAEGQAASGHFERQTFSERGLSITVDVEFAEDRPMVDGAALQRATLRVVDSEGWETIIPAGGLIGCQG